MESQSLLETFNQHPSSEEALLDCLSKLNIVASNDSISFMRICESIDIQYIFNIIEKYFTGSGNKTLRLQLINTSCNLLTKIFSYLKTVEVMEKYSSYMQNPATLACDELNILYLQQILRLAEEGDFSYFMSTPNLIQVSIKFLCEENLETNSISGKILKKLISLSGNGWLFCDEFVKLFQDLLATKSAVMKFRIFDIFVEYISKYPEYIEECKHCKIFDNLIEIIVNGSDILSQLNALEMLSQIATSSSQGLDFVQENGVIGWISNTFAASDDDPLMTFLLPGCVKFFGVLCAANPVVIIPQYKHILKKIFEDVNSHDATMRCLCAETISFICSRDEGLKVMYNSELDSLKDVIRIMTKIISNPGEDDYARERTLQSLTTMFEHDVHDVELSMMCEKLYRYIDDDPMLFLFNLAKIPFAEIRHGSFALLANISKYNWVEQDMVTCPGFMEYILDRSTETEREGRELKYNIIKCLSLSATAVDNLGRDYFDKLKKYCEEGPFYAESHVSVTYEGEN